MCKIINKCLFLLAFSCNAFCEIKFDDVIKFFKFEEDDSSLETNLKSAIEAQLSLPSGQNLWKAFLRFEEMNRDRFSFVFNFKSIDGLGLAFRLDRIDSLDRDNHSAKCFVLDIINFPIDQKDNKSVYRPCLIKLNGEYHFGGEIEVPYFIGLAHELLHALNNLEMIASIEESLCASCLAGSDLDALNDLMSVQEFLQREFNISETDEILKEWYKKLWQNATTDDSLDEMTVILGKPRKISNDAIETIGEVHMLREFHNDSTIIPWSHYSAQDANFWKNGDILLKEAYVSSVKKYFPCVESCIDESYCKDKNDIKYQTVYRINIGANELKKVLDFVFEESKRMQKCYKTIIDIVINYKSSKRASKHEFWTFVVYPTFMSKRNNELINIIPKFYQLEKHPATIIDDPWLQGYEIIDVPEDGNCAFSAVIVDASSYTVTNLRKCTAEKMESLSDEQKPTEAFIDIIKRNGCWNSGIDGGVGIEVLSFVADVIKRPILVLTQDNNGKLCYWISGTTECPRDGNLTMCPITSSAATEILNKHSGAVKIFHNGVHFKAIRRQAPRTFSC